MPEMTSLKRTREQYSNASVDDFEPYFPHSLYLNEEDIEKLGLDGAKVGDERTLTATVRVTAQSTSMNEGGVDRHASLTLELTEGAVSERKLSEDERKSAAEVLYGGNG